MANIPEFISVLRRIRDVIYPEVEVLYENTATLESQAEQSKIAAAASATASASSAGVATTRANEIKNVSAQANTLSSGSLATVSYNSIDGKFTFGLPVGAKGDKGESYTINASGTTSGRAAYDTQSAGFSYLDITLSIVYFKLSATVEDWSVGTSFGRGENGADGANGVGITSIAFHSTTSDNGLASQPGGIDTYRITLSNSNTYDISLANGNDLNINGYGDKTILKDDDKFAIADSDSYFDLKKLSIGKLKSSLNTGFKNYIINGRFDIWQRGTGPFTNYNYGPDRWMCGNGTHNQSASSDIGKRILHTTNTVAESTLLLHPIELNLIGYNAPFNVGKTFTLSVNYNSSTRIKPSIFFSDSGAGNNPVDIFSTAEYKGGRGTNEVVSWTFTVPNNCRATNNCALLAIISESVASDCYMHSVQLEEGSVVTPFEHRPYGLELSLCQRYYETGYVNGVSYNNSSAVIQRTQGFYKCNKRISPSVTFSKITGDALSMTLTQGNTSHFVGGLSSTAPGQEWHGTYTASAEL